MASLRGAKPSALIHVFLFPFQFLRCNPSLPSNLALYFLQLSLQTRQAEGRALHMRDRHGNTHPRLLFGGAMCNSY